MKQEDSDLELENTTHVNEMEILNEPMKQTMPGVNKISIEEKVIKKCWKPNCDEIAIGRDGGGWEWCEIHFDQEEIGSALETKQESYDVTYYHKRLASELALRDQELLEKIKGLRVVSCPECNYAGEGELVSLTDVSEVVKNQI